MHPIASTTAARLSKIGQNYVLAINDGVKSLDKTNMPGINELLVTFADRKEVRGHSKHDDRLIIDMNQVTQMSDAALHTLIGLGDELGEQVIMANVNQTLNLTLKATNIVGEIDYRPAKTLKEVLEKRREIARTV